jgi:hypothetical protein
VRSLLVLPQAVLAIRASMPVVDVDKGNLQRLGKLQTPVRALNTSKIEGGVAASLWEAQGRQDP